MIRPGPNNRITDIAGIRVGNAEDPTLCSGTTVILPEQPAVMAVDVRGGGPATRETEAMDPTALGEVFHGVVLSGGSVFGLAAADAVVAWLSGHGIGLPLGPRPIPVVGAANLFDLMNGGDKSWGDANPYIALGHAACENAGADFALGNAGAGMGATAGTLKGGLGTASACDDDGLIAGAVMAVNPAGEVVIPGTRTFWAWALEQDNELGGQTAPAGAPAPGSLGLPDRTGFGENTIVGVVGVNAALDKAQAKRVAMMAHDGIARAVRPAHTPYDGDTIFVIATGERALSGPAAPSVMKLGAMAADCVARAIARGVYEADPIVGWPAYNDEAAGSS